MLSLIHIYPDVAVLLGISRQVLLEELFGFGSHLAAQHSQSTHVVGIAFGEHTVMDDTHLRGTTAHINVGKADVYKRQGEPLAMPTPWL